MHDILRPFELHPLWQEVFREGSHFSSKWNLFLCFAKYLLIGYNIEYNKYFRSVFNLLFFCRQAEDTTKHVHKWVELIADCQCFDCFRLQPTPLSPISPLSPLSGYKHIKDFAFSAVFCVSHGNAHSSLNLHLSSIFWRVVCVVTERS